MPRRPRAFVAPSGHAPVEEFVKIPALLLDDPQANDQYDLRGTLESWRHGLAGVIEPVRQEPSGPSGDGKGPESAVAGKNDSDTTRALKTARVRYRLESRGGATREFEVADGPELVRTLGASLVVVGFVSPATFPLFTALAQHEATRGFLRIGVSGVRMDHAYNLARKLFADGDIAYHEHTRTLTRVLCHRLDLMLTAHAERQRAGRT